MGVHQPTDASWSDLPALLAERILREAFQASKRSLLQRLRMILVCKCGSTLTAQPCVPMCSSSSRVLLALHLLCSTGHMQGCQIVH